MADEITVNNSLNILVVDPTTQEIVQLDYQSRPSRFTADMSEIKGPTPGAIEVDTLGVDVDLSQLDDPGMCWLHNMDATNYVEYGIYDPEGVKFFPLGEILPGECYTIRLSRNFGIEYEGSGTGTSAATNRLRLKANTASCNVRVDVFGS